MREGSQPSEYRGCSGYERCVSAGSRRGRVRLRARSGRLFQELYRQRPRRLQTSGSFRGEGGGEGQYAGRITQPGQQPARSLRSHGAHDTGVERDSRKYASGCIPAGQTDCNEHRLRKCLAQPGQLCQFPQARRTLRIPEQKNRRMSVQLSGAHPAGPVLARQLERRSGMSRCRYDQQYERCNEPHSALTGTT
jgi:hypothetical protein